MDGPGNIRHVSFVVPSDTSLHIRSEAARTQLSLSGCIRRYLDSNWSVTPDGGGSDRAYIFYGRGDAYACRRQFAYWASLNAQLVRAHSAISASELARTDCVAACLDAATPLLPRIELLASSGAAAASDAFPASPPRALSDTLHVRLDPPAYARLRLLGDMFSLADSPLLRMLCTLRVPPAGSTLTFATGTAAGIADAARLAGYRLNDAVHALNAIAAQQTMAYDQISRRAHSASASLGLALGSMSDAAARLERASGMRRISAYGAYEGVRHDAA